MRRWMIFLVLMIWPGAAMALPDTPYDPQTVISYGRMTQAQQAVLDLLYRAAALGEERVELPPGTKYEDASTAMEVLVRDYPELCALGSAWSVGYWVDEPDVAAYVVLQYVMPVERQRTLVQAARRMAEEARGDDLARETALHDALCLRVTYDLAGEHAHNAWGALAEGRAVCDGYASAMALLLRLADIPCSVVTGKAADGSAAHAWNMVEAAGSLAWLDATNDDQPDGLLHDWFNLTDEWMLAHYVPEEGQAGGACRDESINWHVRQGLVVNGMEDLPLRIFEGYRRLLAGEDAFTLRFRGQDAFLHYINDTNGWTERFMMEEKLNDLPSMQLFINEKQQCVTVKMYNEKTIVDSGVP